MSDSEGAAAPVDNRLVRWARALDLTISHSPGCPGIVVPGVGLLIDDAITGDERTRRIAGLLRVEGRSK